MTETLLKIHDVMDGVPGEYEIIIAMGDREELHPEIPQLPNQWVIKTYGDSLERSILAGFSFARGEKFIICDADNYHPFSKIPEMVKRLDTHEMVAGSRFITGGQLNMTPFRALVSKFFRFYAQLFGAHLSDPMTGFFAVRKDVVNRMMFKPYTWKIALEIDIKTKPTLYEFPIVPQPRTVGVSKSCIKIGLKLMRDIIIGY